MKIELEGQDIEAVALRVVELIRPALALLSKQEDDTIYDPESLAQYLRVDVSWIYKKVSLKAIPYFKSGKYTRFRKSAIDKWIEMQTVKPVHFIKQGKGQG
ncbi:MAG: helix-turn-helix domain-containing protein [Thermodesulfovibrionales bacterium]